jgi:hypothetical protein
LLSEASIIQPPNFGSYEAASGTPTLPDVTTEGSTVLLVTAEFNGTFGQLKTPDGFQADIPPTGAGNLYVQSFRRPDVPAGESSWPTSNIGTSISLTMWFIYEIAGMDRIEPLGAKTTGASAGVTSLSSGTSSPSVSETDLLCLDLHAALTAGITIDGHTGGFVAAEYQSQTSTHGNGSAQIARLYPGAGGTFACTATYSASVTAAAVLLVYKAAAEDPVSLGGQVTMA